MIKTASEKEAQRQRNEAKLKENNDRRREFFNIVAATEEGRDVFRYRAEILGVDKHSVIMNHKTGEVNRDTTVYVEARRSVYLDVRKYISDTHVKEIEFS